MKIQAIRNISFDNCTNIIIKKLRGTLFQLDTKDGDT